MILADGGGIEASPVVFDQEFQVPVRNAQDDADGSGARVADGVQNRLLNDP
jgi:hypothetical protein